MPLAGVVGIEQEVGETGGEVTLEREFLEEARPPAGAVEIEVRRERLRLLVQDVERAVEVVHEESPAARLVPQKVHPGQQSPRVLPIEIAGDRHLHVVFQLERQLRRLGGKGLPGRNGQRHNPHRLHRCRFRLGAAHRIQWYTPEAVRIIRRVAAWHLAEHTGSRVTLERAVPPGPPQRWRRCARSARRTRRD